MIRRRALWLHCGVLLAYAAIAVAFSWPLTANLSTHLTGSVGGDTGVYVWNQWVFRHEILDKGSSPYFTDAIFGGGRPANLGLHNYTTFQNLLALPLAGFFGRQLGRPGAGRDGGQLLAAGRTAEVLANPQSVTAAWLSGRAGSVSDRSIAGTSGRSRSRLAFPLLSVPEKCLGRPAGLAELYR